MKLVEKAMEEREYNAEYGNIAFTLDLIGIVVSLYRKLNTNTRKFLRMVAGGIGAIAFGYMVLYIISVGIVHFSW